MCGIAGILSPLSTSLGEIAQMTKVQSHRGPDGEGYAFVDARGDCQLLPTLSSVPLPPAHIALGHRRLAVLDTSKAGLQPMSTSDGAYTICYNGEVYNYLELKAELEAAGSRFHTGTDTEVVLEAFRRWGTSCFSRFNGMWALAIWDRQRRQLVLSRDRFGIKPLYLTQHSDRLYFASEIKSLLTIKDLPRKLNRRRAADFLRWGVVDHTNETFFNGITSFPPGHFSMISMDAPHKVETEPFWCPPATGKLGSSLLSKTDAEIQFRTLFDSAVALRQRSDVPVGACLSGGLDSSAIVCTVAQHLPNSHQLATFTSASTDPVFDERAWSNLIVEQCNTNAHTIFPESDAFIGDLDQLIKTQEQPFPSASIYAQYLLMRAARRAQIPVLLDGQGADEVLCGYRKYTAYALLESAQNNRWMDLLAGLAWWTVQGDRGLMRLSEGIRYLPRFIQKGSADPLTSLVASEFLNDWSESNPVSEMSTYRSSERQIDDLLKFSVPPLLRYEDRNSMAWSIESRVPFLDYRLVEFMLELPTELKVARSRTKSLMRSTLRGRVPDPVLDRRDKMGFVTPQRTWMTGPLKQHFAHQLQSSNFSISSLIDGKRTAELLDAKGYWAGAALSAVFRVFILDKWAQIHNVDV